MHVLLVEPNYYTRYPPLGLLKLSSFHRRLGNTTEIVRVRLEGFRKVRKEPDRIYITSLWTWAWRPVWEAVRHYKRLFPRAEVWLGGLYASLLPEHAALSGADYVYKGIFKEAEDLLPDYSLIPDWDGSIIFSSRGCIRTCPFCAVPKLEGSINSVRYSIKHLIYPSHTKVILWDNNILASPGWRSVFDELEELGMKVDFNQGLDARLITNEVAVRLSKLKLHSKSGVKVRLGYDVSNNGPAVRKAIERLKAVGIRGRDIMVYVLYNFQDDPEDFKERVTNVLEWGATVYPMRFEPTWTKSNGTPYEKNEYISSGWTREELEMIQDARRVLGYGGAFPPYRGLLEKFRRAKNFIEAFELRPPKYVKK